jgi:hypothetical protein
MVDRKKLIPVPRLLAVAALAGAFAGAVAVYVSTTLSGNNAQPSAAGAGGKPARPPLGRFGARGAHAAPGAIDLGPPLCHISIVPRGAPLGG